MINNTEWDRNIYTLVIDTYSTISHIRIIIPLVTKRDFYARKDGRVIFIFSIVILIIFSLMSTDIID